MSISSDIRARQVDLKLHSIQTAIVLGVGGIGSWVALDLALSGSVGNMVLVDPDVVETSNLNRTPFRLADVGESKVAALKYLILERRAMPVEIHITKTSDLLADELLGGIMSRRHISYKEDRYSGQILNQFVIIDCRDDVYTDFYKVPFKYYKVGYDGTSVTIDGNPRNTAVWGQSNGYRFTPSFVCSAQFIANLVVSDILLVKDYDTVSDLDYMQPATNVPFDQFGRFNASTTFDCNDVVETMYRKNTLLETKEDHVS